MSSNQLFFVIVSSMNIHADRICSSAVMSLFCCLAQSHTAQLSCTFLKTAVILFTLRRRKMFGSLQPLSSTYGEYLLQLGFALTGCALPRLAESVRRWRCLQYLVLQDCRRLCDHFCHWGSALFHFLEEVHSHPTYSSVGLLAVLLRRIAVIAKMTNLQGLNFWFDLISVNIHYLSVCNSVLSACAAIHRQ